MIITNKYNLPQAFVEMATREYKHQPNEYRVTSLLKGIRETILERRHHNEIKQDISDMIWLLFGTAVHSILERQQESDCELTETRIKIPVGDYILSGQFDLYNEKDKEITDYKTASVWKVIFGDFSDWRRQLLIYSYMMRRIGFEVERGRIVAMLKDHSKRDAKIKADYPQLPVTVINFEFSDDDFKDIHNWLHERFYYIGQAEQLPDDELPICTPEERFNSGDKYAVMKNGRKTALRVLNSVEEAEQWMRDNGGDFIETRKGEDKKCLEYCAVCEFCNYYHSIRKEESANG